MTTPFFSIILATYNRAHLLTRAIQSVLAQSYQDWELIVVDDGSTDHTPSILQDFLTQDLRIRFVMNPHQGLCLTRNTGISLAQGKYLTFLDSDDEYLKEHLQLHADCLSQKKETQALSSRLLVTGNPYVPDARDLTQTIHVDECTPSGTFFVRKDVLLKLGGFPIVSFGEDHALFKKLQAGGIPLEFSNLRTYKYHNIESDSLCNALLIQREEPLK